jgi:nicotinamidase-related amidase
MPDHIRPYEPLTWENAALVLVDHQVGLMTGVRDYSIAELTHNVVALAKAAKALKLPIVVTTTARDSMWGHGLGQVGWPNRESARTLGWNFMRSLTAWLNLMALHWDGARVR